MRIFAITNQKGGVGKTTTAVNLAASLKTIKRKVLMVDLDPQGNATMGSGVDKNTLRYSVYDVLTGRCTIDEAITPAEEAGYDLLPANADLTAAEVELLGLDQKEHRLCNALRGLEDRYDYVIIDCPPSLSMLTVNALVASDSVIIPMQCEYYALEGLSALINTITGITKRLNPELKIEGLLRTMFDPRNSLTRDVSNQLIVHFGDRVYDTVIPRNVRLAEAPSYGLPALVYDRRSRGAMAYLALAGEVLRKSRKQTAAAG
ncbi:MAG: AAA family ATPase [Pseudomonadales bacterium]